MPLNRISYEENSKKQIFIRTKTDALFLRFSDLQDHSTLKSMSKPMMPSQVLSYMVVTII